MLYQLRRVDTRKYGRADTTRILADYIHTPVLPMLYGPRLPNVFPEGMENTIGVLDILVPGGVTRMPQPPTLGFCPWVFQAEPDEAV